jgi:hypothetical protein
LKGDFSVFFGITFLAAWGLLTWTWRVCEETMVPFFLLKEETVTVLQTIPDSIPYIVSWTDDFTSGYRFVLFLEMGLGSAMVGSSSWMANGISFDMVGSVGGNHFKRK